MLQEELAKWYGKWIASMREQFVLRLVGSEAACHSK